MNCLYYDGNEELLIMDDGVGGGRRNSSGETATFELEAGQVGVPLAQVI